MVPEATRSEMLGKVVSAGDTVASPARLVEARGMMVSDLMLAVVVVV